MRQPTDDEIADLARTIGVEIDRNDLGAVGDGVRSFLDGLDAVDTVPAPPESIELGERSWSTPDADPLNALVHECTVPPKSDADDLLAGTSVGVKDVVAVAGIPMTAGSRAMQGYTPRADAVCVDRLRGAGATVTAKTNNDELATSGLGTTSYFGPIRNPYDPERRAGGSSGGSAVAVATGRVDVALGTDTAGSVQGPAAYCGVVGLKPSYGLVPLSGVVEHAYTIDHVGAFGRSVGAVARTLEAMAGKSESDPASMAAAGHDDYRVGGYTAAAEDAPDVDDCHVALLEDGFGGDVQDGVHDCVTGALDALESAGATVTTVSIPHYGDASAINQVISYAELYAHWVARGAPVRRGGLVDESYQVALAHGLRSASGELGTYYKQKVLAGAHLFEAHAGRHYTRAQATRRTLRDGFAGALDGVDALACPTRPTVASKFGDSTDADGARNTRPVNVIGFPSVSLPCGSARGMPVGMQMVGPRFGDADLLGVAAAIEAELDADLSPP